MKVKEEEKNRVEEYINTYFPCIYALTGETIGWNALDDLSMEEILKIAKIKIITIEKYPLGRNAIDYIIELDLNVFDDVYRIKNCFTYNKKYDFIALPCMYEDELRDRKRYSGI